jgi:multiple sugar transport system permease protein
MNPKATNRASRNREKTLRHLFYHIFCIFLAFFMLYPILWMISGSFKTNSDIFLNSSSLIPVEWRIANYTEGWNSFGSLSFATFFKNSFIITILSTLAAVISSSIVGYGFARNRFIGRNTLFAIMLMTMMLPYQIIMIPQYIIFHKLKWINTFLPLIVPNFFGIPFFIFLTMQFIYGIPKELDESATIDGCNKYSIFARIILPLLKAPLVTVAIFQFYWTWEDLLRPLLYLSKPSIYTVSVALSTFLDPYGITNWGAILAMSALSLIPVVLIFFFLQRYIVEGIQFQGVRG